MAAQQIMTDGTESWWARASNPSPWCRWAACEQHFTEEHLLKVKPALWMTMIETAEIVAERYGITRERQDEYSLESQKRTAAAQQGGKFNDEIVPLATKMK